MAHSEAATGSSTIPPRGVPAAGRGVTRIADRVVAKIASQAAREVLNPLRPEWFGDVSASPHATVSVRRGRERKPSGRGEPKGEERPAEERSEPRQEARVRVSVELAYPSDIGAQCREVRRQIVERVGVLADMDVPEVVVTVERLHSVHSRQAGGERAR